MRRGLRFGAGGLAGSLARRRAHPRDPGAALPARRRPRTGSPLLLTRPAPPETFLAWVPRGLPEASRRGWHRRPEIGGITVVAEDNVWLARSWSAAGELVDHPARPYRIPLDVGRGRIPQRSRRSSRRRIGARSAAVENGEGILGSTSASVRRLGPGALLELGKDTRIRIAAVLPDELVGAAELLVSKETGRRIGVTRDRYLLLRPVDGQRR